MKAIEHHYLWRITLHTNNGLLFRNSIEDFHLQFNALEIIKQRQELHITVLQHFTNCSTDSKVVISGGGDESSQQESRKAP